MNPTQLNSSNELLIKRYAEIYPNGSFGYDKDMERVNLWAIIKDTGGTLLDVGCGDGFWSDILSEKFEVTGIDISPDGIAIARRKYPQNPYILYDFLKMYKHIQKFDTVFLRSPSFLNFPTESKRFYRNFEKCVRVCNKSLWFIKWSVPPYDRYLEASYIHDPAKVKKVMSRFGKVEMHFTPNYFYANLLI
jgi:SAM-dependent methyltransferase